MPPVKDAGPDGAVADAPGLGRDTVADAPSPVDRLDAQGSFDGTGDGSGAGTGDGSDGTGDGTGDGTDSGDVSGFGDAAMQSDSPATDAGIVDARTADATGLDSPADKPGDAAACEGESEAALCAAFDLQCGNLTAVDRCGASRTIASCGACTSGTVCAANHLLGHCSVPATVAPQPPGMAVPLWPRYFADGVFAIQATSPNEVWLASHSGLVRVRLRPGAVDAFYPNELGQTATKGQMWASSPSDVWLVSGTVLLHFDGTAWKAVDAGLVAGSTLTSIHGTASDNIWVAGIKDGVAEMRRFDGSGWSAWPLPVRTVGSVGTIVTIAASSSSDLHIGDSNYIYRWNGLSYTILPSSEGYSRIWVSPTSTLYRLYAGCGVGFSTYSVDRRVDTAWRTLANGTGELCSHLSDLNLAGKADAEIWAGTTLGRGVRYDGAKVENVAGYLVAPTGTGTGFSATATQLFELVDKQSILRLDTTANDHACSRGFADGTGSIWLACGQLKRFENGMLSSGNLSAASVDAVYTAPSMSVWAALSTGAIEQRSASGTTTHSNFLGSKFVALAGTRDSNVWAATASGAVAHFDGNTWTPTQITLPSGEPLSGLTAAEGTAWAWTAGTLFQWSGTSWAAVTAPTSSVYYLDGWAHGGAAWFLTSPDVSRTVLYSFDGSSWQERRAWSDYRKAVGGIDGAGVLTLHQDSTGAAVLERWQDSGPTKVGTVVNGTVDASLRMVLAMPTATSVLYGNRPLYLARFE